LDVEKVDYSKDTTLPWRRERKRNETQLFY
jgi:hypothetical protein